LLFLVSSVGEVCADETGDSGGSGCLALFLSFLADFLIEETDGKG
jgi:hypothetical protein